MKLDELPIYAECPDSKTYVLERLEPNPVTNTVMNSVSPIRTEAQELFTYSMAVLFASWFTHPYVVLLQPLFPSPVALYLTLSTPLILGRTSSLRSQKDSVYDCLPRRFEQLKKLEKHFSR
ncbi:unnamed protein product [Schistosoma haematobium]|nr:unnamed protein product [Schistosoma haematobium]